MTEPDEQLAEATDELLSSGSMHPLNDDNRELGKVVTELYQIIEPNRRPSDDCQELLVHRLNAEWDRMYAPPRLRLIDRPYVRVGAVAAAVVLVLAALLVLAVPGTPDQLQGAAIGLDDGLALVILIAVAAGGAVFYWRSRR